MNLSEAQKLRDQIIDTLRLAASPMTLSEIHIVLERPRSDISILPIVGRLVQDGLVEKVAPQPAVPRQHPDWPAYVGVPVRFRLKG